MDEKLKKIGKMCKDFRQNLGFLQSDVSNETNYSIATISAFECGRDNNMVVFLWYILKGLDIKEIVGLIND